jgi:hypothetical protein
MGILRRDILRLSAGLAALPVVSRLALADTYPSRPVRVLVATSAGGSTDIIGRLVAQYLTEKLGQPFFNQAIPPSPLVIAERPPVWRPSMKRTRTAQAMARNPISRDAWGTIIGTSSARDLCPLRVRTCAMVQDW